MRDIIACKAKNLIPLSSYARIVQSSRSFGRYLRYFWNKTLPQDDELFLQVAIKRASHPERSEGSDSTEHIFLEARVEQTSRSFGRLQRKYLGKALLQDDVRFFQLTIIRACHSALF